MSDNTIQDPNAAEFTIQKIYTKDLSFESPSAPGIFQQDWNPELNIDIRTQSELLTDGVYEVVLTLTATVKSKDKPAFLVEVVEAGIFTIKNIPEGDLERVLYSMCPGILFPYVREIISEAVGRGGFPPLYLAPINFDALYDNQKAQEATQDSSAISATDEVAANSIH